MDERSTLRVPGLGPSLTSKVFVLSSGHQGIAPCLLGGPLHSRYGVIRQLILVDDGTTGLKAGQRVWTNVTIY